MKTPQSVAKITDFTLILFWFVSEIETPVLMAYFF